MVRSMGLPPTTPPLLAGRLDRRTLLKAAGWGGLFLGGGAWLWHALLGWEKPMKGLRVFDSVEFDTVEKVADAMFPGPPDWPFSAQEVGVAHFVDLYVWNLYEDTQQLFRMLIRTLNVSTLVSQGAVFRLLPRPRRVRALAEWAESELRVRRAGYQSLSFALHMGYFEDERVRRAAGFSTGCALADEATRPDLWKAAAFQPKAETP